MWVCQPYTQTTKNKPQNPVHCQKKKHLLPSLVRLSSALKPLNLSQHSLIWHRLPVLVLLHHLRQLVDLFLQLGLAHLLLDPRFLDFVPHLQPHPVQHCLLRCFVQFPCIHRPEASCLPRCQTSSQFEPWRPTRGLVHGLGLGLAEHHRFRVLGHGS